MTKTKDEEPKKPAEPEPESDPEEEEDEGDSSNFLASLMQSPEAQAAMKSLGEGQEKIDALLAEARKTNEWLVHLHAYLCQCSEAKKKREAAYLSLSKKDSPPKVPDPKK